VVDNSGGLFQVTFLDDGTVVLPRGIGIAPKAPHANTAKLFLDFVLSSEGQRAVVEGSLTSYRDDVTGRARAAHLPGGRLQGRPAERHPGEVHPGARRPGPGVHPALGGLLGGKPAAG